MTDLLWAVLGGMAGSLMTALAALFAVGRGWGKRVEQITEVRNTAQENKAAREQLDERVRSLKETVDRHIGAPRSESLCTRSE